MNDNLKTLSNLAKSICSGFINWPEKLHAKALRLKHTGEIVVEIDCDPKDFGKLIGKKGENFKAVKLLMEKAAANLDESLSFSIPDPGSNERTEPKAFSRSKNWDCKPIMKTVHEICNGVLVGEYDAEITNASLESYVEVLISEDEILNPGQYSELSAAIKKVINAHAKNQGWHVHFELVRP